MLLYGRLYNYTTSSSQTFNTIDDLVNFLNCYYNEPSVSGIIASYLPGLELPTSSEALIEYGLSTMGLELFEIDFENPIDTKEELQALLNHKNFKVACAVDFSSFCKRFW